MAINPLVNPTLFLQPVLQETMKMQMKREFARRALNEIYKNNPLPTRGNPLRGLTPGKVCQFAVAVDQFVTISSFVQLIFDEYLFRKLSEGFYQNLYNNLYDETFESTVELVQRAEAQRRRQGNKCWAFTIPVNEGIWWPRKLKEELVAWAEQWEDGLNGANGFFEHEYERIWDRAWNDLQESIVKIIDHKDNNGFSTTSPGKSRVKMSQRERNWSK